MRKEPQRKRSYKAIRHVLPTAPRVRGHAWDKRIRSGALSTSTVGSSRSAAFSCFVYGQCGVEVTATYSLCRSAALLPELKAKVSPSSGGG